MEGKIAEIRKAIVQIATPHSTGTGLYLKSFDLIVTNEHIIRSARQVVVENEDLTSQLSSVLFIDEKYDIAFLSANDLKEQAVDLEFNLDDWEIGTEILALGHPFGMQFTSASGIISNDTHLLDGVNYLKHDASLNSANSGGPLIDKEGRLIGINTFIFSKGEHQGFTLPLKEIVKAVDAFRQTSNSPAQRCPSCQTTVVEKDLTSPYCPNCGTYLSLIKDWEEHHPVGIYKTMEEMLGQLGFDVALSRRGPAQWFVQRGSAGIKISYHEKSGLIIGDAYLVLLPDHKMDELYRFLLQENYKLDGLTFSVQGNHVVLSLLVYDQYFDIEVSSRLFQKLFDTADHYDDVLVNQFGAKWTK
jgi:serine protease Do